MEILMTIGKILAALLVFGIIILVHEFGHFIVAKLTGVKVNEFAMGMGPKLLQFGKKETVYTLRLFPIGGFCAMEGEDPETEMPRALGGSGKTEDDGEESSDGSVSSGDGTTAAAEETAALHTEAAETEGEEKPALNPRSFAAKKVWQRILITIAGATMNLLLGFVLLLVYYGFCVSPQSGGEVLFSTTTIAQLPETARSYQTGLRAGDEIIKINGRRVVTADFDMMMALQSDEDGVFDMVVKRTVDGERQKVELKDVAFELKTTEDGTRYLQYDFILLGKERTFLNTLTHSLKNEYSLGLMIWRSLGDIVTGKYGLNDLSGPVGTVDVIGDAVEQAVTQTDRMAGIRSLLLLVTMITVNVGIFNLLPLPALDGGRLIFLIFEGITRRPIPAKYEGMVHFIGLILLMLLMLLVTFGDISKLVGG